MYLAPSPIHEFQIPGIDIPGISFYIKRDDLIHPLVSGNKWRKLEGFVKKAKETNKLTLVTKGGAYSNHLLATAVASAALGFKSKGWVRGEIPEMLNPHLFWCKWFGMELIPTSRTDYSNWSEQELLQSNYEFFIPEGGTAKEAELGIEKLALELGNQWDHIFIASGTGTTATLLANAMSNSSPHTKVWANLVLKTKEFQWPFELIKPENFMVLNTYHFGGYAKTTQELIALAKAASALNAIVFDQVYTAKTLYAMSATVKNAIETFEKKRILFVHTGGQLGPLGLKSIL